MGFLRVQIGRLLHGDDPPSEAAFLFDAGRLKDLNDLISAASGWTLESAHGINDRGQIVGMGLHRGQRRAFLLTPMR